MTAAKGYYSLIQYCPDLGRLDAANIGVLLFCPERYFLKALTSGTNRRIIRFFGREGHDWTRINSFKKGLEDRIAIEGRDILTVENLEKFIAQRANLLQITPPRPMRVNDPQENLEALFKEFMGDVARHSSTRSLRRHISEKLTSAGLTKKIRENIKVRVPTFDKEVEIPFGYQNGRFNLISLVRFEAANPEHTLKTACKYAVEGSSLHGTPDPELGDLQLVVVGRFRSKDHESPRRVKRLLENYEVKLFRLTELSQLIEEIRRTGKDLDTDVT